VSVGVALCVIDGVRVGVELGVGVGVWEVVGVWVGVAQISEVGTFRILIPLYGRP
jgi:hypothetical protein